MNESKERTGSGVTSARAKLYATALAVKTEMTEAVASWARWGVPVKATGPMIPFEAAAIDFARAKSRARNKRDKWKRAKRGV